MADAHRLTELESGVRIVTEAMPSVRSAALGFWIGTGSASEAEAQAGLSHLVEHMLFRGTGRFASTEIDERFDAMGAELNAGTGRENTNVYSRVLDRHLPEAFDVMADMVWRPLMDGEALGVEREIVLEEIAMYEDDPQDMVFDLLGEAAFGEHPLGRPVIGRAEVVAGTSSADLAAFHRARYVPSNVVIAAAGSVDHEEIVALARAAQERGTAPDATAPTSEAPEGMRPQVRFTAKDTEQYHVTLGWPGITRFDERRFALRVLDTILGGTSSSRLFQEVRERRGLAYSVSTFSSQYATAGQVGLYLGTRPENLQEAMAVVAAEIERFAREGATAEELTRARENLKGRVVLSLESTTARMSRLGSAVLGEMPVLSVDEIIARIDGVRGEDVAALAGEVFAPGGLAAAGIGADEAAFRTAVAPLGEPYARAA